MTMRLGVLIGARPNVPKAWTVLRALRLAQRCNPNLEWITIHSGQHHHPGLGPNYAAELGIEVDRLLEVGSRASDASQVATLHERIDEVLHRDRVSHLIVFGDVNTSVAGACAAARRGIHVIHVEAGLRSTIRDPEEVNRRIISACATIHLAPSFQAALNLAREGVPQADIHFVGNTMAETFLAYDAARSRSDVLSRLNLVEGAFACLTLHKPSTLSRSEWVRELMEDLGRRMPVVFPQHPHAKQVLGSSAPLGVRVIGPLSYVDFGKLITSARVVVTDSDGVQEEATVAGTCCVSVTEGTARPETITHGTNALGHYSVDRCRSLAARVTNRRVPDRWDAHVSERIARVVARLQDIAVKEWHLRPGLRSPADEVLVEV